MLKLYDPVVKAIDFKCPCCKFTYEIPPGATLWCPSCPRPKK